MLFFCFKQKTAYEMRISDWSSDVCSSDLLVRQVARLAGKDERRIAREFALRRSQRGLVGVGGKLARFVRAPAMRLPGLRHLLKLHRPKICESRAALARKGGQGKDREISIAAPFAHLCFSLDPKTANFVEVFKGRAPGKRLCIR